MAVRRQKSVPSALNAPHRAAIVERYLSGENIILTKDDILPEIKHLSDFTQKVLLEVCHVPRGRTMTYKAFSEKLGHPGAFRAVGNALGKNPLPVIVPCHRIVGANGLGGYAFGVEMKKALLDFEAGIADRSLVEKMLKNCQYRTEHS